jgi:uncharacterized repeat protein (TIGR01451 family)
MKTKLFSVLLLLLLFVFNSQAQILRPFTVRYGNPSVRGNIVYVANNSITSVGANPTMVPPGPGTAPPAPAATTHANNGRFAVNINADATTVIPWNSTWRFSDSGYAPGAGTWKNVVYPDALWSVATANFFPSATRDIGYGDGDEVLPFVYAGCGARPGIPAPTCGAKNWTTYFRQQFNIASLAAFTGFRLNLHRDDGAVIYVNGVEVARSNMPAGAIIYTTPASAGVEASSEDVTINIPAAAPFVTGNNVIAVEVHQRVITNTADGNDLSFRLELLGLTTPEVNNSTADLSLLSCSSVMWAGLYWGATQGTDGTNVAWITGETAIKLKVPGAASYTNITSTQSDYHNNTLVPGLPHTGYRCFADITSLINSTNPNGTYTVANLVGPTGIINGCGGWTIVVAYSNPTLPVKNLTVFDGSAIMNGGDPPLYVPITGFLTPPLGPVSCELGAVVYDGDRVSVDSFKFKQNSNPLVGAYTDMTTFGTSRAGDAWNSTISANGAVVTTRNPAHQNTMGYDADIFSVPIGVLGNSQTSASIKFMSPSENYMLQVASTSISVYNPSYGLNKSSVDLNGGLLAPGDVLRYTLNYTNVGNDASTNTIITDNLPSNVGYVPGSLKINGLARTDASADDQAEYDFINRKVTFRIGTGANAVSGGTVSAGGTGTLTFDVVAASSCAILACGNNVSNSARADYAGQTSLQNLFDSSYYDAGGGCFLQGPVVNTITGTCFSPVDTTIINICPSTTVRLPLVRYAGYSFYSAMPFIPANIYNPAVPVTVTGPRVFYAYFNSGIGCADTIRINILHQNCPDLDEDDDGIPDYLELNNPVALQDHDFDGIPNWNDVNYPGWIDNNTDGLNDNFDPGADSDNDGQVNFMETGWPGYVDSNGDGINDNMDKDLDGIPNFLDRDSDNDGIPDVVESFGVDANGDGKIDNYTDPDSDGLSQNVDGSIGVAGSGNGLGAVDTDGDGIPNYLDIDSDNDGIPDVAEVYGTDANNDGRLDGYADSDFDGYADSIDGDVGNDGVAENAGNTLLRTGTDTDADGRANSYPYKNMDNDSKANPYDLDSDSDGITDTREAGFADTDYNGRVDGTYNTDGWSTVVAALPSLSLPNTDATGRVNVYDIDADDDGIPDNIEGQMTTGYFLPSGTDTDLDGIDNVYDNFAGFGGDGIHVFDRDGDTIPDYMDSDTDGDGLLDIVEGNDFNLNGLPDDNVTLTGVDTDGDGLDDRFDNNNSSVEGTSQYMGNGGSTSGDPSPGSITTVQHTTVAAYGCTTERDWRCNGYVLYCDVIRFKGVLQDKQTLLDWTVLCDQEVDHFIVERSINGVSFSSAVLINSKPVINESESYHTTDDVSNINSEIVYYRLRTVLKDGKTTFSSIITILCGTTKNTNVLIFPNPVRGQLQLSINAENSYVASIYIVNVNGKTIKEYIEKIRPGSNTFRYSETSNLSNGVYYLLVNSGDKIISRKFNVLK